MSLNGAAPVLSVLEKLRIESANSAITADMDEKKRKRSTSIDILIQSSLYLSMTSRDSLSSGDEGDIGGKEEDTAYEPLTKEAEGGDMYDNRHLYLYSASTNYQNHAPFSINSSPPVRSHSPSASDENITVTSTESRSINISDSDADSAVSVFDDSMSVMVAAATAAHKALHSHSHTHPHTHTNTNTYSEPYRVPSLDRNLHLLSQEEPLPRTRRSNRPRASTFSVSSHTASHFFDTEAERTPLGMITWLASLEDDDFVAAKLLAEFSSKEKNTDIEVDDPHKCDIPKYRGTRSKDLTPPLGYPRDQRRGESVEPPTQRRRRANSVIEVTSHILISQLTERTYLCNYLSKQPK